MAYRVKAYMLREESMESGTGYSISFKDGRVLITRVGSIRTVLYGVSADGKASQ